jgi:hypothetical protein
MRSDSSIASPTGSGILECPEVLAGNLRAQ